MRRVRPRQAPTEGSQEPDFCWLSGRRPNVYASLAVAYMFLGYREREFAKVMANLLFWLGPDRIIWVPTSRSGARTGCWTGS